MFTSTFDTGRNAWVIRPPFETAITETRFLNLVVSKGQLPLFSPYVEYVSSKRGEYRLEVHLRPKMVSVGLWAMCSAGYLLLVAPYFHDFSSFRTDALQEVLARLNRNY